MFTQEFTPARNYFFLVPSREPTGAGLMRLKSADAGRAAEWYPSFLLVYDEDELRKVIRELDEAYKQLLCSYATNSYEQLEFLFHRQGKAEELVGGLTLALEDVPPGAMVSDGWSLGLAPNKIRPRLEELVSFYEFQEPVRYLG